nr:AAA family ATPase [Phormidium yuhuli]
MGARTAVYRALHNDHQRSVIIKVLQLEYPTFGELMQFRNQYVITKNLPIPGIVQPLALERLGNSYALIMEDENGLSLSQYLQQQSLELEEILEIALQLANILHDLQQHRVIHKDIKPANILIHPERKTVKLIDFSIASLLPKETQEIQSPNILEGTLAYLAPEQTGRMNRGIDYRADFYALGVTLYQLLSGQLPFQSNDPMELVHDHIAKSPKPLAQVNPAVPAVVAAIVAKLMAKNAEDRYQNALGLQYDLQHCLTQWRQTGEILEFELGERDISDRFLIPEKLYGRDAEVQTLLEAFERVAGSLTSNIQHSVSELMLVAGFSGIGKTAVVNEIYKPVTRQKGYFIKGKFDQFNRNIPLSAFAQALRDLMGQLLSESDAQLAQWKAEILKAVGENGQILIEVIPELERVIGQQPPAPELSGSAIQNRFNLLFQNFIQVFTTAVHPLVIFLDDLQWADSASLQLLKVLLDDNGHLLVLGAYRDNEVSPTHPLMLTLEELEKANLIVNTLTLAPLSLENTNHLVADTLKCTRERATTLTELVNRKTKGNPFFTTQFLKVLHEESCILFDYTQGYWNYDIAQVNALALTDDVVEFVASQLQKLSAETQQVLQLAACIGNQFDLETLAIVAEQPLAETAVVLWEALQEGLICPLNQAYKSFQLEEVKQLNPQGDIKPIYRFLHDRIQQASYSLIPNEQRQLTHYKIGKLLLQSTPSSKLEENIFNIVSHLNQGSELIESKKERCQVSKLNLMAGERALAATAYSSASKYLENGIKLLGPNCWKEEYQLTLSLYNSTIKAEYLTVNYPRANRLSNFVLERATSILDCVKVYELQIQMYMAQSEMLEALAVGELALELLGVDLNNSPAASDIYLPELSEIESLPVMQDPHHMAIMSILMAIFSPAYTAKPELLSPIVLTAIELSLKQGHTSLTAFAYVLYGILQCGVEKNLDKGYYCGLLALNVLERFSARELECKVVNLFNVFIKPWKTSVAESIEPLERASQVGFEMGDIEYASYASTHHCTFKVLAGRPLVEIQKKQNTTIQLVASVKQDHSLYHTTIWHQLVLNLLKNIKTPERLLGDCFDESKLLGDFCSGSDKSLPFTAYLAKCILSYLFGDYSLALESALNSKNYADSAIGVTIAIHNFYYSLCLLSNASALINADSPFRTEDKQSLLGQVEFNQENMQKWAISAPENFRHKFNLVAAEKSRILGQKVEAIDLYDLAIAGAKANGYVQEEALANELAAKFYLDWGKEKFAASYIQEAYYSYAYWGAKAKVADLERRYPQLLQPILQPVLQPFNLLNTVSTISRRMVMSSSGSSQGSSSSLNQALDLGSVIKASQALSGTLELDELLSQLTQIILQNSGGDRCTLIIPTDAGEWQVRAITTLETVHLCAEAIAHSPNLPLKLIQYVKNTQEVVTIDNLVTDLPVLDQYLETEKPKSVLGLPILTQGRCLGILYLQNQLSSGVFTPERMTVLNFLCTQAAISLENARLYQRVQQSLTELQEAQLQLVQSEKMSALGGLVSGVAHEINNPVGCILGNVGATEDYVQDLLGLLDLYGEAFPEPGEEIEAELEAVELDYVRQDLPQLIRAMRDSGDRIKSISKSLRTFSRKDTDSKQPFDIHEGLDSTLLILRHRLKANEHRPEIEVVKDYGNLPPINCFPGQLNQVFMNLLANAIDVFDEMAQESSFAALKEKTQRITLITRQVDNEVTLTIADNGSGIPEEIQPQIFDHLFTTKAVGKGTGLGLAIARQIVVDVHRGQLNVNSQVDQGTEFIISLPHQNNPDSYKRTRQST